MYDILKKHVTIRKYNDRAISEDLLHEILTIGCRASNTGNMQVYSIIITRDATMKEKLSPCHFNQPMVKKAPVVLTICADFNRFETWCKMREANPGYDNFLSFMTAAIDATIVAQNICVAAESQGLGICYLGTTIWMARRIIEILKLPKGVVPITTITLGWPDEEPKLTDRLPLDGVIHYETYKSYDEKLINEIYSQKEDTPENIEYVRENNKKSLAQVFTDIRYKKTDNESFSKVLLQVLHDQGFLD